MKYFVKKSSDHPLAKLAVDNAATNIVPGVAYEMTEEKALFWYRLMNRNTTREGGIENLIVQPEFRKGVRKVGGFYEIWGENISNRELFRRRLNGQVAKEVIDK